MRDVSIVEKGRDSTKYNFTKDQDIAVSNIIDFIAADFNPARFIIGLTGAGGTGKTYVTNYIITRCKYSNSVIKCASPTHKACRIFSNAINGKTVDTIQSVFGLRPNLSLEDFDPTRPQFSSMTPIKLDNIKLLIIDEASMLPASLVTFICNRCKEREIKVIFIGDKYQLTPVNERRSIAFDRCFAVYDLKEIVRQSKQNPVTGLLPLLRQDLDNNTHKFIEYINSRIGTSNYNDSGEGFTILNPRDFKDRVDKSFSNNEYTKNIDMYRIIGYTNNSVSGWNNYIRNSIIKDSDKSIITKNDLIMSYETIINEFMEIIINNSEEYIVNDIVNYVDEKYEFKGFLVKFQLVNGGNITTPLFVIDHRDKFTILKYHKIVSGLISNAKSTLRGSRAGKWKEYYEFKKKYLLAANIIDNQGKILYSRDIDYGFSITAHKSQGSTYDHVFVDVNDMIYNKHGQPYTNHDDMLRRLYVACSRASKELIISYGR